MDQKKSSERNHVIITGTGRAGTTFLVQLLTKLDLDTGFNSDNMILYDKARAGLEHDIRDEGAPYIIKCPWFIDHVDEVLIRKDIIIDHVYVPMRDINAVAKSGWQVVKGTRADYSLIKKLFKKPSTIAGGLWGTDNKNNQELVLLKKMYQLFLSLSDSNIPITVLKYPRITSDSKYLYKKFNYLLGGIEYKKFLEVYNSTIKVDLVHQYSANDL